MIRNFAAATEKPIDVLVVGGGIFGAGAAWDLAGRGLRTLLVDKGDFGGATSAGCFKIIHGGLRYLQHADFVRLTESVKEQQTLRQIAPHLVYPLPFLIPCYKKLMQRKTVLSTAMTVYEFLSWYRNSGVEDDHRLPRHRAFTRDEVLAIGSGFNPENLTGGVAYYDCQMSNADRLTFSIVASAVQAGAQALNYCSAARFLFGDAGGAGQRSIEAVELRDELTGATAMVRPKAVVNAAGPWHELIGASFEGVPVRKKPQWFSKGVQIAVPELVAKYAFAVESTYRDPAAKFARGARSYFVHPWRGHSLIGTTDSLWEGNPDQFSIDRQDLVELLEDFRRAYPSPLLTEENVKFAFGGLRQLAPEALESIGDGSDQTWNQEGAAKVARKDRIIDHAAMPFDQVLIPNLVTMQGVKYTTFRKFAEDAANIVAQKINCSAPSKTRNTKVSGAPGGTVRELTQSIAGRAGSEQRAMHLVRNYGAAAEAILDLEQDALELARPLGPGVSVSASECVHAARNEMAQTLSDIVLRRTPLGSLGLGSLGSVPYDAVHRASLAVAGEMGWTADRARADAQGLADYFARLSLAR